MAAVAEIGLEQTISIEGVTLELDGTEAIYLLGQLGVGSQPLDTYGNAQESIYTSLLTALEGATGLETAAIIKMGNDALGSSFPSALKDARQMVEDILEMTDQARGSN